MRWSVNRIMRAVNLWREGKRFNEIAALLDVPVETVAAHYEDMKRYGLEKL